MFLLCLPFTDTESDTEWRGGEGKEGQEGRGGGRGLVLCPLSSDCFARSPSPRPQGPPASQLHLPASKGETGQGYRQ